MNTPVSFPLAKLLKQKGFKQDSYPCYGNDGEIHTVAYFIIKEKESYFAPAISDIVMWLYDKYNIWISVDPENDTNTWFHTITHGKSITAFGNYTSSTEAYEKGIEHILTDLI